MNVVMQLKEALIGAPLTVFKLKHNCLRIFIIYLATAMLIFGVIAGLLLANEEALRSVVMTYFFPSSWHNLTDKLVDFFFESQAKIVISNLIISGSIVSVSICLFPLKEHFSATFERENALNNDPADELSLALQGWEEFKLFIIYLTAQLSILWIGYYPIEWTRTFAICLSFLFLFFSFGLDLIAPTLQRHKASYSLIIKVLFRYPVITLSFGILYCTPVVLLSKAIVSVESLSLLQVSIILFMANLVFLALAVPGGTWIASKLYPYLRETSPPLLKNKTTGYSAIILILCLNLFFHSRLAKSLHHKSQFLKCHYTIDWGSVVFDLPSFQQFFSNTSDAKLSFDLETTNPTPFDLVIENSTLIVEQQGNLIATVKLDEFSVKSGETVKNTIQLNSEMQVQSVSNFGNLLNDWSVNLKFELWPGIDFTVNIVGPDY